MGQRNSKLKCWEAQLLGDVFGRSQAENDRGNSNLLPPEDSSHRFWRMLFQSVEPFPTQGCASPSILKGEHDLLLLQNGLLKRCQKKGCFTS